MEFKLIRKEVLKQVEKRHEWIKPCGTQEELNELMQRNGKQYKGDWETQYKKMCKYTQGQKDKDLKEELDKLKFIEEAGDFNNSLIITIEWKKSRMWGSNPTAYTNFGFNGDSIGGCGYCKTSTATAEALNSHLPLLKMLYVKEEMRLRKRNKVGRRDYIGYGSGYFAMARFEGGVGVSSHEQIIRGLGLNMRCVTSTKITDVYEISK